MAGVERIFGEVLELSLQATSVPKPVNQFLPCVTPHIGYKTNMTTLWNYFTAASGRRP
jgi:hypothetical protein